MSDRPRIYVRPLASYTRGDLHGAWIDAAQPVEGIRAAIAKMTAEGPVPGADEWAIHDSEGFGFDVDEYESLEKVSVLARALVECGQRGALAAWLRRCDINDEWCTSVEVLIERFQDQYVGCWDSYAAMAEDEDQDPLRFDRLTEAIKGDPALEAIVERIRECIDWEKLGVELDINYTGTRTDDGLYVFDTTA